MAEYEIGEETPREGPPRGPGGWSYDVTVFADGRVSRHTVTLSFQDYDHWSHGRVGPSRVVDAAMRFILDRRKADEVPQRFDCSMLRRTDPDVDGELPRMF